MAFTPQPMRQIGIQVTQKVAERLQAMAKEAGMPMLTFSNLLFDAAYSERCARTTDADLDAQVALVGLATLTGAELEEIASAAGLEISVAERMRDGWRRALDERRQAS